MEDNDQSHSDEEIVRRALVEQRYFGEIIDRFETKLDRYISRLGVQRPEDREDVLQDIFIKVYKNLNGFDTSLSFSSWIYRIAHNEAISWYRRQRVRPEGHLINDVDPVLATLAAGAAAPEQLFDQSINAGELQGALYKLEEKYRTVLILRFFEHKEYEEISDILRIPTGSVGTLIYRGKKQLAQLLDPEKLRLWI